MLKAGLALLFSVGALASLALWKGGSDADRQARAAPWTPAPEMPSLEVATVSGGPVETEEGPIDTYERRRRVERSVVIARATTLSDLATAGGWIRSLAVHHALPPVAGFDAERARFAATLREATNPVARQNVIFLAVLTLPTEVSHPWLFDLMKGGLGGDAEDALVALAFDGDAYARAAFARLATEPSRAPVRRLLDYFPDHEELGQTGTEEAREVLRSYRAIEVLDREPYFKYTFFATKHRAWVPHPTRGADRGRFRDSGKEVQPLDAATLELDRELLTSWVARYPGHPGCDDMAWRLGRIETLDGAHLDAARWFSRAATMPDQDMCDAAVGDLVTTCEVALSPEELDRLAHEQGLETPNRVLVQYIRLRRLAAERGFDVAILYAAALGRHEPRSVLGYSWNHRYAAPVPKGLDSGLVPLPYGDPLRATQAAVPFVRFEGAAPPARLQDSLEWQCRHADEGRRLDPWRERLEIDEAPLMQQFRAWDAIAALEPRAAQATGDARADLLYKQAAILYHDPRAIFPAYADLFDFRRAIRDDGNLGGFVRTSYPLVRAIRVLERIENEHPTYPGIDKVLFSRGLAWVKLIGYQCEAHELDEGVRRGRWDELRRMRDAMKIREAVAALERCTTLCPTSPLADDAWRAVLYWRRTRPEVFQ